MPVPQQDLEIQEAIRRLELVTRKLVSTRLVGGYKSAFKGRGLEFDGFREYGPGDDAALIDWKASARSDKTLIREFLEERNLEVFFLIDNSSTMDFGTQKRSKYEFATELVASMSYVILSTGDSVGLGIYLDGIKDQMLPTSGSAQYYNIISKLSSKPSHSKSNLKRTLEQMLIALGRGAFVVIISDFIGVGTDWKDVLGVCTKKFEVIGICIRDPRDMRFPEGVGDILLGDPFVEKQYLVNADNVRQEFERAAYSQLSYVKRTFQEADADFLYLETSGDFVDELIKFFTL